MRRRCWHRRLVTRVCLTLAAGLFCVVVGSGIFGGEWPSSDRYLVIRAGEVHAEWGPIYISGPPVDDDVGCIPQIWIPGVLKYGGIYTNQAWPTPVGWFLRISVWGPLLVTVLIAVGLILYDTRPLRPGRCACGYDLTGNESGICPECGMPSAARQTEPEAQARE